MALSFILGVADSSSFQDADLSGANLAHLYLKDADLSYANLLGAYIPNPGSLRFKLRGANWWDSQTVSRGLTKAYCGSKGQFHSVQGDLCDFGLNPGSKKDVRADKATRSAYKMSTLVPANIVAEAEEQFEKEYPKSQNYQDRQKHEQLKRGTPLQSPFSTPTRE